MHLIQETLDISTGTGVDISKQWMERNTSLVLKKIGIYILKETLYVTYEKYIGYKLYSEGLNETKIIR